MAYSMKIVGSLYVKAIDEQPSRCAAAAKASGDAAPDKVSISRDLEMSQFWQNRQARLQPAVPKDRTGVPGRKWFSGFFSTGSTQNPLDRPYEASTTWSSIRPRTKHNPRCPSRSRHARGHTSHWIRPSASSCQYRVGTVYGSARLRTSDSSIGSVVMQTTRVPRYLLAHGLEPADVQPQGAHHLCADRGAAPGEAPRADAAR